MNVVDSFVIISPDIHDRDRATLDREIRKLTPIETLALCFASSDSLIPLAPSRTYGVPESTRQVLNDL